MSDYETRHRLADEAEERKRYAGVHQSVLAYLEETASRSSIIASLKAIKHGHKFGDNRTCSCGLSEKQYDSMPPEDLPLSVCVEHCHEPT